MEVCLFAFFFLAIAVAAVIGIAVSSQQKKTRASAFQQLAARFGGTSQGGGFFEKPSAHFNYQGVSTLVDTYSTGGKHPKHYLQLRIYWPQNDLRCEVYPEGFFLRLGKMLGMEDVEIGSPHFDRDYIISGGSAATLSKLLSPSVQQPIDQLRHWTGNGDIYILWSNGVLLVKKRCRVHRFPDLLQFTTLALQLFDAAMATRSEGITFVATTQHKEIADEPAVCQICGDEIIREIVYCRSCKTPHHLDCWQYYGACSVYGCGQTKYVPPQIKRPRRKTK